MKNQLDKAIRRVMAARHAKHRRAAVLVILALLTILSVSWRLHQVGIAMTDDEYSCGYEEHVHSDACYTEVLICGYVRQTFQRVGMLREGAGQHPLVAVCGMGVGCRRGLAVFLR